MQPDKTPTADRYNFHHKVMLITGGGAIVNVSSTDGIPASANANAGMYSAIKHCINRLTIAEHDNELEKIIPASRVGRADEIAAPIV